MKIDVRNLRRAMAAKDFTAAGLAKAAEVAPSSLNNWLNHGTRPRIDTIGRLAKALGVDIYDIAKD